MIWGASNLINNMQDNKYLSKEKTQALIDGLGVKQSEGKAFLDGLAAKGYTIQGFNDQPKVEEPTMVESIKTKLSDIGGRQTETIKKSAELYKSGQQGLASTVGQTLGASIKAAGESFALPVNEAVSKAVSFVGEYAPENIKQAAAELAQKGIELTKPSIEAYNALPESERANIKAVGDLFSGVTNLAVGAGAIKGLGTAAVRTTETLPKVGEAITTGAKSIIESPIVSGTGEVIKSAGRTLKTVPENIATNVGEMQAKEAIVKSIPSVVGQNAARKGVEVVDINTLKEVASTPQAKTLIKAVKDFSSGTSKVDPIEIVGKPIVAKIKALDKKANEVGAKLGEVAKKLDVVTKPELESSVILRLKQVPGLKDLEVDEKGVLDFGRTTLTSDFTKADREAIQMAYDGATRWGNGEKAHKFRQELFEVLDGKKKSLTNLTDTQDKALNAIRAGLSDVLETKNPEYKKLSNDYRKIVQPLSEMRKLSKTLDPNNPEDVLNLSAGLLARRLTSAAASNPQIRMVLGELDKATKVKGKTLDDTQKLQDLYNVLNKYYDIAPKTGFQNLVKEGVSSPTGIIDQVTGAVKEFAGTTNAVRQKALEDYLLELLSKTSNAKK